MKTKAVVILMLLAVCLTGSGVESQQGDAVNVAGTWSITIKFIKGTGHHTAIIEQDGNTLSGIYEGEILKGSLRGTVNGDTVDFTGSLRHESSGVRFHYTGTVVGETMQGTVEMGEYWSAQWTAKRTKK